MEEFDVDPIFTETIPDVKTGRRADPVVRDLRYWYNGEINLNRDVLVNASGDLTTGSNIGMIKAGRKLDSYSVNGVSVKSGSSTMGSFSVNPFVSIGINLSLIRGAIKHNLSRARKS